MTAPDAARHRARVAAHESWARTPDRAARTAAARRARWQRYLDRAAELHPNAAGEVLEQVAEHLRQADMARMSLKAAAARRARRQGADAA